MFSWRTLGPDLFNDFNDRSKKGSPNASQVGDRLLYPFGHGVLGGCEVGTRIITLLGAYLSIHL